MPFLRKIPRIWLHWSRAISKQDSRQSQILFVYTTTPMYLALMLSVCLATTQSASGIWGYIRAEVDFASFCEQKLSWYESLGPKHVWTKLVIEYVHITSMRNNVAEFS